MEEPTCECGHPWLEHCSSGCKSGVCKCNKSIYHAIAELTRERDEAREIVAAMERGLQEWAERGDSLMPWPITLCLYAGSPNWWAGNIESGEPDIEYPDIYAAFRAAKERE